jgi:hypothetical protein
MQTINLLASPRPNLGVAAGRVGVRWRPRGGALLPVLGRTNVRRPYQQNEATTLRTAGRQGTWRTAAAVEPRRPGRTVRRRRMGRWLTQGVWGSGALEVGAGRGGSRPRSEGRRRRTGGVAGSEGVGGSVDDGFREPAGGGESRGAEDGGRRRRQWSGRMTAVAAKEDKTTTMAADQG